MKKFIISIFISFLFIPFFCFARESSPPYFLDGKLHYSLITPDYELDITNDSVFCVPSVNPMPSVSRLFSAITPSYDSGVYVGLYIGSVGSSNKIFSVGGSPVPYEAFITPANPLPVVSSHFFAASYPYTNYSSYETYLNTGVNDGNVIPSRIELIEYDFVSSGSCVDLQIASQSQSVINSFKENILAVISANVSKIAVAFVAFFSVILVWILLRRFINF